MLHYNSYITFFCLERNAHLGSQEIAHSKPKRVAQHTSLPGKRALSQACSLGL